MRWWVFFFVHGGTQIFYSRILEFKQSFHNYAAWGRIFYLWENYLKLSPDIIMGTDYSCVFSIVEVLRQKKKKESNEIIFHFFDTSLKCSQTVRTFWVQNQKSEELLWICVLKVRTVAVLVFTKWSKLVHLF